MNSSMIGKIEKAHRYAGEPERVRISEFRATFHGSHDEYTIELHDGHWHCSCHTFESQVVGTCAHVMALQQMLAKMLPEEARYAEEAVAGAG
jgi:predicted nucleic acid-binding Zn finger protein